jgi:hypothetical protein
MIYITRTMAEFQLSEDMRNDIPVLTKRDEEELYAILGEQLIGIEELPSMKMVPERLEMAKFDLIERGKAFFNQILPKLKTAICDEWKYCEKEKEYLEDYSSLVKELTAIIGTTVVLFGFSLPAASIAVIIALLLKYGLRTLCGCT